MPTPDACPRCGSTDLHHGEESPYPDICGPSFTECDECEHRWGEAFPDSQAVPLPDGFSDCQRCERRGFEYYGAGRCGVCHGDGIIQTALLG